MPTKIVLFNGPKRAGKDTAAKAVIAAMAKRRTLVLERFSGPLKVAFASLVGAGLDRDYNVIGYEERKDEPLDEFGGKSFRDFQISYAEDFMQKRFGDDIFSRLLCMRVQAGVKRNNMTPLVLVPDCGFQHDVDRTVETFGVNNVLLVRIERAGVEWDTRGYVKPVAGMTHGTVVNGEIQAYRQAIQRIVGSWDRGEIIDVG